MFCLSFNTPCSRYGGQSYKTTDILQSTSFGRLDITTEILQNFSCSENASHLNECSDMEWTERSWFGWDRWNILSIRCWTYAEISKWKNNFTKQ